MYRKPDYETTDDIDEYLESWKEFAIPIEKFMGMTMNGFDPGIGLVNGDLSVMLPTWFVRKFNDAYKTLTTSS
jgi:hypothetical protein